MALTHALATNNYGPNKLIVATSAANGTHTTLAAALADSSSGDTIYLRNSVTENVTLVAGVTITSTQGSENIPGVSITGKCTFSAAGTAIISGIQLITNSDFSVVVSGSNASILYLNDCYVNSLNNTSLSFTSSNAASRIILYNCGGNLATTGIAIFSSSSTGIMAFQNCVMDNTGSSSTASTISAGTLSIYSSRIGSAITTSSTAAFGAQYSQFNTGGNVTAVTANASGSHDFYYCSFSSGSAVAISIGSSGVVSALAPFLNSSNSNLVSGAGSFTYRNAIYGVQTGLISSSTKNGGTIPGIADGSAIQPGYIGEHIQELATGVVLVNNTATNVGSISLSPGVWDISAICQMNTTGLSTEMQCGISSVSATLPSGSPDAGGALIYPAASAVVQTITIPSWRTSISSTTTYYCVMEATFTTGSSTGYSRMSAVRAG